MCRDTPKVKELTNYVVRRINEYASDDLNISEEAWRSQARDVVSGVMRSCSQHPENGVRVVCDSSNNPQFNIDNNVLSIDVIITNTDIARKIEIGGTNHAETFIKPVS